MRRREFIGLVGGAAVVVPLGARGQQPAMPVIGLLHQGSQVAAVQWLAAFRQGLNSSGYVEGRNVLIEYRWAEGQYDRLPELAADLVGHHVAVIAVAFLPAALATKAATVTIPIVFLTGSDPVAASLVPSLNQPNSNVTGLTMMDAMLGPKNLELLHELVPNATVIAVLVNRNNVNTEPQVRDLQMASRARGVQLVVFTASHEAEIDAAFATLAQRQIGAMLIATDGFFYTRRDQLASLAVRHGVPVIYFDRAFPLAGGLMSYGPSIVDGHRELGIYTARILRGEKPADLPVQQSTKVELVINLKAAKAIGLTISPPLFARADEVIE